MDAVSVPVFSSVDSGPVVKQEIIMVGANMSKASLMRGSVSENQE